MAGPRFLSPERRTQLSYVDPRWRVKLGFHLTIVLLAFTGILLFAAAIPRWNANFFHNKGPMRGDWTDGISIGPLTFTLLFSIFCASYFFTRRKPLPPKLCIAIYSLILLALAPSLFIAGSGSLFRHWRPPATRTQNGVLVCNLLNVFSRDCEPVLYSVGELQIAGIAFGGLVWVLIFMLLLISIFEARAAAMNKPRLPRRLTLTISNMEKGYRKARDQDQQRRQHHSHRHGHRQHGTRQHYRGSRKEEEGDTVPIFYIQEPQASYPPQGHRYQ